MYTYSISWHPFGYTKMILVIYPEGMVMDIHFEVIPKEVPQGCNPKIAQMSLHSLGPELYPFMGTHGAST